MTKNFSERYGFVQKKLLVDEIPIALRASFIKEVLTDFYLDRDPDLDVDRNDITAEYYGHFDSTPLAFLARTEVDFLDLTSIISISVGQQCPIYKGSYIGVMEDDWMPFWIVERKYDYVLDDLYFPYNSFIIFDRVKKIYMQQGDYLLAIFRDLTWYQFFDVIELIIQTLKTRFVDEYRIRYKNSCINDEAMGMDDFEYQEEKKNYHQQMPIIWFDNLLYHINNWLDNNYVDWQVDSSGKFVRKSSLHQELLLSSLETGLQEEFPAAYAHFLKAKKYCFNRPLDPENAVKEIVTALESLGKTFFPGTETLTGVRMGMKKKGDVPESIMSLMEQFYYYANNKSGVRHGQTKELDLKIEDAELCFYFGGALINYMLKKYPSLREEFEKESPSDP